jgi:hypothetical protein
VAHCARRSTVYGGKLALLKAPTRDGRLALDANNNNNVALSDQPMARRRQRLCAGRRRRWAF